MSKYISDPAEALKWAKKRGARFIDDVRGLDPALELDKIVKIAVAFGKECVERGAPLPGVPALFPASGSYRTCAGAMREEVQDLFAETANYLAQRSAHLAVLVQDMWVSPPSKSPVPLLRPSLDPNRTEALVVSAVAPDGRVVYVALTGYARAGAGKEWIQWGATDESLPGPNTYQGLLRPWLTTINGETVGIIRPTRAGQDRGAVEVSPYLDEDGRVISPPKDDSGKGPAVSDSFMMQRREYLLSEAPQYLRDAFNAVSLVPIEAMLTNGMTLNGVRYRIYRDEAAREVAKTNGVDDLDKLKMENPSEPIDPNHPPAEERPAEFYANPIVREWARRLDLDRVTWWPLLLSEAQARILEYLIERQGEYAVRPTAAQMVDAAVAFASDAEPVSDKQFDNMLGALRSKLQ